MGDAPNAAIDESREAPRFSFGSRGDCGRSAVHRLNQPDKGLQWRRGKPAHAAQWEQEISGLPLMMRPDFGGLVVTISLEECRQEAWERPYCRVGPSGS